MRLYACLSHLLCRPSSTSTCVLQITFLFTQCAYSPRSLATEQFYWIERKFLLVMSVISLQLTARQQLPPTPPKKKQQHLHGFKI